MAWGQIGAMPFVEPMLINHGLEQNEQISLKYFAGFALSLSRIPFKLTSFLGCQNSTAVYELKNLLSWSTFMFNVNARIFCSRTFILNKDWPRRRTFRLEKTKLFWRETITLFFLAFNMQMRRVGVPSKVFFFLSYAPTTLICIFKDHIPIMPIVL